MTTAVDTVAAERYKTKNRFRSRMRHMDPGLGITIETLRPRGGVCVRVVGELDLETAPRVDAAIDASPWADESAVVLDLTAVTFIDSSGLAAVLRARDALGERLTVVASPACERLFDLTGVSEELALTREWEPRQRRRAAS